MAGIYYIRMNILTLEDGFYVDTEYLIRNDGGECRMERKNKVMTLKVSLFTSVFLVRNNGSIKFSRS